MLKFDGTRLSTYIQCPRVYRQVASQWHSTPERATARANGPIFLFSAFGTQRVLEKLNFNLYTPTLPGSRGRRVFNYGVLAAAIISPALVTGPYPYIATRSWPSSQFGNTSTYINATAPFPLFPPQDCCRQFVALLV